MSRYTINIGDEFPLQDEAPGAGHRRFGFGLRALFALAVAAIVLSHPFHAVLFLGAALLLRRTRLFGELRARWRAGAADRHQWMRNRCNDNRGSHNDNRGRRPAERADEQRPDRYKAFV